MEHMQSSEIRNSFLAFFESKGHKIVTSSSLVPEGDISVLFTTAGMQQFKGYYSAPQNAVTDFGTPNVTSVQKCVRTGDIDEVGDATHLSFFEMLGNFSFGGYGRKEAIEYAHEFITQKLGLTISYVTIYRGEGIVPKDEESYEIWRSLDENLEIREDGADVFWGPTGDSGPCGPTTEIYLKNADGVDVEVWNIVFNEYFCDGSRDKLDKGEATLKKLDTLGIDTGMGFERLFTTIMNKKSVYDTDLFEGIFVKMGEFSSNDDVRAKRIVADHIRTSVFMIADGVIPGNSGRGYILRRLLRRAIRYSDVLGFKHGSLFWLAETVIEKYKNAYPALTTNKEQIKKEIDTEESKFRKTLENGMKEFEAGVDPFILATTYGFPIELTEELSQEKGISIDREAFDKKMVQHQSLSRTASAGMFKGGLANHNTETIKLHTAHHLLLAALQVVVDPHIKQRGSNITEERLRIDFMCDHKLTDEEKIKVEEWVNDKIKKNLTVIRREMPLAEAQSLGAEMEFGAKYPDIVSVYFIEDEKGNQISKEFCGGPHVTNTSELGHFKIQKEEAVSQGVRRIKAILG
jgi:alanyl-tRNA synthetase